MTLVMVDLPGDQRVVTDFFERVTAAWPAADVEILPSVYVVEYGSVEHGPAVFVHAEDAEAFAAQHDSASVVDVPISDAETAKTMMESEEDE